jgi:polyhydroxybutyrate depolymerase
MRRLWALIISTALLAAPSAAVAGGSDPQSRPALPSVGCGSSTIEPGPHQGTMEVAGLARTWQLAVPATHDGQTPLPLVIGLHGGAEFNSSARLLVLAKEEGFVTVAPRDAQQDWWMVWEPQLADYYLSLGNPDIAFVDALIDRLGEELCLDLARVYATGFSIGSAGTSVLACVLDDRLAAAAPNGALVPDLGETCNGERPVSILAVHGTRDMDARYDGSVADWFLDTVMKDGSPVRDSAWGQWLVGDPGSVPERLTDIAVRYGCEPDPSIEPLGEAERHIWACPHDAAVELVAHDGGHTWESSTDGRTTEQLIWDFFEQHPLPE